MMPALVVFVYAAAASSPPEAATLLLPLAVPLRLDLPSPAAITLHRVE